MMGGNRQRPGAGEELDAVGGQEMLMPVLLPAELVHKPHVGYIAVANTVGWTASLAWILLGTGGVAVLLTALAAWVAVPLALAAFVFSRKEP